MVASLFGRAPSLVSDQDGLLTFDDGTSVPREQLGSVAQKYAMAASPITPLSQRPDAVLSADQLAAKRGGAEYIPGEGPGAPAVGPAPDAGMSIPAGAVTSQPVPQSVQPPPTPAAPMQAPPMGTVNPLQTTTDRQTTIQSGVKADPKAVAAQDAAFEKEKAANTKEAEVAARKANADADYLGIIASKADEIETQRAAKKLTIEQEHDAAMAQQTALIQDFQKTKIDPNAYFKEQGTLGQILGGIGMVLSAAGAAATGKENLAMQAIDEGVKRNIEAQVRNADLKKDRVNLQGNLVAQLRQKGVDNDTAAKMATEILYSQAQNLLRLNAAKFGGDAAMAGADKLNTSIDERKAEFAVKRSIDAQARITSQVHQHTAPTFSPADLAKMGEAERSRYVPGFGIAPTEDDAKIGKKYNATHDQLVGKLATLKALVDEKGNESIGQSKAQMVQLRNLILAGLKDKEGLGAMSDSDREFLEKQVADPTTWFGKGVNTSGRLQSLIQTLEGDRNAVMQAHGIMGRR